MPESSSNVLQSLPRRDVILPLNQLPSFTSIQKLCERMAERHEAATKPQISQLQTLENLSSSTRATTT